jgi:hypothetical protein
LENNVRRGLIQCGKVINSFCSEADFRQKEASALVNEFIDDQRERIRQFIDLVIEGVRSGYGLIYYYYNNYY